MYVPSSYVFIRPIFPKTCYLPPSLLTGNTGLTTNGYLSLSPSLLPSSLLIFLCIPNCGYCGLHNVYDRPEHLFTPKPPKKLLISFSDSETVLKDWGFLNIPLFSFVTFLFLCSLLLFSSSFLMSCPSSSLEGTFLSFIWVIHCQRMYVLLCISMFIVHTRSGNIKCPTETFIPFIPEEITAIPSPSLSLSFLVLPLLFPLSVFWSGCVLI